MDTGEGKFELLQERLSELDQKAFKKRYPKCGGMFTIGEMLEIKGSRFQVSKIIADGLKLKLIPKD